MSGFVNPFAPKCRSVVSNAARIKDWVRKQLDLAEDIVVSVNQVACREPGCPDVETVIGILRPGQPVHPLRVERPVSDVVEGDVALAIQASQNQVEPNSQGEASATAGDWRAETPR